MSRDLDKSSYYVSQGGLIPIKWTAPEVHKTIHLQCTHLVELYILQIEFDLQPAHIPQSRHCTIESIPVPLMSGALECSCLRYGQWVGSHLLP